MNKLKLIFSLIPILLATNLPSISDESRIDNYLQSYKNFSGAVLITQNGNIILNKGYGYANHEFLMPNTPKTKFQIASNTKSFTAFAIMHLQQKNLLNTQDKLNKYINDYQNGDKVTIHHLLTHTSGIPNYYKYWNDVVHSKSLEQMVSSFKPLGMHDTGSYNLKLVNNRASGYIYENNIIYNAETPNNPVTLLGNGDLYSSLEDLYKWDRELQKNKDLIFTPHIPMEDSPSRAHGYGWFIDKKFDKRIVEYSGSLRGFLSRIIKFIDDDITVIILSNLEDREEFNIIYEGLLTTIFLEHT